MNANGGLRTVLEITSTLATVAAAVAVTWAVASGRGGPLSDPRARAASPASSPTTAIAGVETTMSAARKENNGAKLAIIEFSDFECPFCGKFARETYPQLISEFVDTGKVNYSFRHFPLESIHKNAFGAGEAFECAGRQNKYCEMHDTLFANQKALDRVSLVAHAKASRLDEAAFKSCFEEGVPARIKEDQADAQRFGIKGTPSFLVGVVQANGKVKVFRMLSGAQPFEAFQAAVAEVIKEGLPPPRKS